MQLFPTQDPEAEASTYENSRKTGFKENWSNALGLAMTEDLPLTSPMIPSTTESQRNKKIYEYINDGSIPRNVSDFYYDDPDGLAGYAKNVLGLEDIPTLDEFNEQKQLEYKYGREMANDVFAKQSKLGMFGELAGRAHAMALDPLYASSFLTGYGTATTIGQAALRAGLIEAGIELAAQPSKMSWKEEIGADYGGAQALTDSSAPRP